MPTSPVYCSHFTFGNPKSHFSTVLFIHISDYLHYLRRKQTVTFYSSHLKMSPHYLLKCTTFSSDWRYVAFLQTLVALKITCCEVWQMECQTSNITGNVQSDHLLHRYMFPVFFATDRLYRPPRSAEIQPMSQQDASATRPYSEFVLDTHENMKKMKNLCKFYKIVRRHFAGVVGKELTICFLIT